MTVLFVLIKARKCFLTEFFYFIEKCIQMLLLQINVTVIRRKPAPRFPYGYISASAWLSPQLLQLR